GLVHLPPQGEVQALVGMRAHRGAVQPGEGHRGNQEERGERERPGHGMSRYNRAPRGSQQRPCPPARAQLTRGSMRLAPLPCLVLAVLGCAHEPPPPKPAAPVQPVATTAPADTTPLPPASLTIPVESYTLSNGLKVVLSRDTTAPVAVVGVYYHIGFRIEPRNRTGFAHLFEHMMFQGSENLGKLAFIRLVQSNGGVLNGSTRFDFTNYFELIPSNVLQTVLWAEA